MTPATRLLLVVSGSLVLLLAAIFLIYPYFRSDETVVTPVITTPADPSELNPLPSSPTQPVVNGTPVVEEETPVERTESQQRAESERLTRMFVELFGSYSNFSEFSNITSVEPFMTDSMKRYTDGLKKEGASSQGVGEYVGVTSQLISLNIARFEVSSRATVNFVVQQETQHGLQAPIETAYRDGHLDLVYRENQWLVNGIFYN